VPPSLTWFQNFSSDNLYNLEFDTLRYKHNHYTRQDCPVGSGDHSALVHRKIPPQSSRDNPYQPTSAMTTNLNAIAGPSRLPPSPLVEVESPSQSVDSPPHGGHGSASGREPAVSKPGLSVDENGEVVKVPAFLNKLFR
jgi:hypothetical protein